MQSIDDRDPMPQNADVALTMSNIQRHDAQTSNTTTTAALGDALAVAFTRCAFYGSRRSLILREL